MNPDCGTTNLHLDVSDAVNVMVSLAAASCMLEQWSNSQGSNYNLAVEACNLSLTVCKYRSLCRSPI